MEWVMDTNWAAHPNWRAEPACLRWMESEPVECPPELATSITPGSRCRLACVFSYLPPPSYRFLSPSVSQLRLFRVVLAWYIKTNDAPPQWYPSNLGMERNWCQRSVLETNAKGVRERDLTAFYPRAAVHCRLSALTSPPSITTRQSCGRANSCPLETTLN